MKGNFAVPFSSTTRIFFFFFGSSFQTLKKNQSSETDPWQIPNGQSQTPATPRFLTGQENELPDEFVVDCNFLAPCIISTIFWLKNINGKFKYNKMIIIWILSIQSLIEAKMPAEPLTPEMSGMVSFKSVTISCAVTMVTSHGTPFCKDLGCKPKKISKTRSSGTVFPERVLIAHRIFRC